MLTVCPKCTLTLAVTAADLRVGQGYVRCGRCATVFNALLALSDASTLELGATLPGDQRSPFPMQSGATATVSVLPDVPPAAAADAAVKAEEETAIAPALPPQPETASDSAPAPKPEAAAEPAPPPVRSPMTGPGPESDSDADSGAAIFPALDVERFARERLIYAGDEDDEITIDPSLASAPLDIVLEQTGAVGPVAAAVPVPAAVPAPAPAHDATGTVQKIVMEGSSISHSEEFVDIDTIDSEIAAATRRALEVEARRSIASLDQAVPPATVGAIAGLSPAEELAREADDTPGPQTITLDSTSSVAVETRLSESGSVYVHDRNSLYAPRTPPPKPPPSLLLWSIFASLLLMILAVQAIHFWRNDIALRNDWIGRGLTKFYSVLALPLTPNWDLHGYDVRQLGAATNGSGDNAIRVRIRLSNRAKRAQPFPVLRLSLYDRYGKRVAARDLQPRDYLPKDRAAGMMPVSQQIDSEVAVMDPGPDASSFELDVCMPGPRGLRCASDSPLRPSAHS